MCGFAGFFSNKPLNYRKVLEEITNVIDHRGPDDTSFYLNKNNNLYVGFKRLSIIDLSKNGMQPINSYNGKYTIFFNGEIYNYQEIKKMLFLSNNQIKYKGNSDTEVLVNSFEYFGIDKTLELIHGQFSIALYDNENLILNLIRDRFGEKPLYYGNINNSFVFGSELKSFINFPNFNNKISKKSIELYLRFLNVPSPLSIFEQIYKVEPAEIISINLKNKHFIFNDSTSIKKKKYWNINKSIFESKNIKYDNNPELIIENKIRKSIEQQSYADVPIASLLSGGVDSSLICALYQSQTSQKINTFTIGFNNSEYNEAKFADSIAKHLQTNHHQIILDQKRSLDIVSNLSDIYSEPFADSSQIPTYLVSNEISKYYKVALSGDGGDELFGGYNRYIWIKKLWQIINFLPFSIRKYLFSIFHKIKLENLNFLFFFIKKITFNFINIKFGGQKLIKMSSRLIKVENIDQLFMYFISEWTYEDKLILNHEYDYNILFKYDDIPELNIQEKMMLHDTKNYLPNDILVKTDLASMSNSIELRSPFLNTEVFNAAWSLPIKSKVSKNSGKLVLNNILKKHLPQNLFDRPKQGFAIPIDSWLRNSLSKWAKEIIFDYKGQDSYFNNKIILKKWNDHQSGKANWGQSLWAIIIFNQWQQNLK